MNKPLISIIVPVFNTGSLLERCIDSVLRQTFEDYEIIIVDDGSQEDTGIICDEIEKTDSRITVFHKENRGQLHTRVFGITKSNGKYIMFLDSDDYLSDAAFLIIKQCIDSYSFDCLIFGYQRVRNNQIVSTSAAEEHSPLVISDRRELLTKVLLSSSYNALWRKVVRRESITRYDYSGFYHLRMAEDLLQSMDIYCHSNRVVFINDILYNYFLNSNGVTQSLSYNKIRDSFDVHTEIERILESEDVLLERELTAYHTFCYSILAQQIFNISNSKDTNNNKIKMLKMMHSEEYVRILKKLSHNIISRRDRIILRNFWHENYRTIICFCNFISNLKQIINMIRKN